MKRATAKVKEGNAFDRSKVLASTCRQTSLVLSEIRQSSPSLDRLRPCAVPAVKFAAAVLQSHHLAGLAIALAPDAAAAELGGVAGIAGLLGSVARLLVLPV
jgi:hypothetical protein